ncbi:DUF1428 domain-containing protein [Hyphomonas sp.]|uniref:DUF1428 domain-containing protein n=1 Tax=Hyphomonas sp. TaxID=87 RepID=UPI0025B7DDB8|nr:DUF1428 domain-containing protein [Hyphomonas sp.]MBI1400871.1 DUF1428 family protein [Hyphomonas sp.]
MAYIDGFVLAVPSAKKDAYQKMASDASAVFRRLGAIGLVENWGLDVPQGKVNCFNSAVMRRPDETVMFSWIVWPDRAARDAGNKAMMEDPAFEGMSPETMPFDGQRMIFGGFEQLFGDALAAPGIVDGTLMPVPAGSRAAYLAAAEKLAAVFVEHGATSVVDAWGDDLPEGKVNSFHTAVLKKPDENVIFSWINWKDAATRQAGWDKAMADPRMAEFSPVTTGADLGRMIYGTFEPIVTG